MSQTVSTGNNTGLPDGTKIAADIVGTPAAPAAGDTIQYVKLDLGAAGASAPAVGTVPTADADTKNAVQALSSYLDSGNGLLGDISLAVSPLYNTLADMLSAEQSMASIQENWDANGVVVQAAELVRIDNQTASMDTKLSTLHTDIVSLINGQSNIEANTGNTENKLGVSITTPSPAMPAGGSGVLGWLSAIWTKLNGSLAVTGTFWPTTQPVSGTFWQATQPVSGTFWQATQPVSGPLTDTQLRATAVPVSGPLTDTQLRASSVPVSTGLTQPLTDTQLRATAVPVSGPLTDTQLRASSVPVKQDAATTVATVLQTTANTSQANALTLAAAGASLFHIIDSITITRVNNATTAVAADTTARQVTSSNLNSWQHEMGSALAAGGAETFMYTFPNGLKSAVANTATTFSLPAGGAGTKIRVTVVYRTGT